jgi:hypothetical protein
MLRGIFRRKELNTLLPNKYDLLNIETNKIYNKGRSTESECEEFEHFPVLISI